jgi:hypothetical protein
MIIGGASWDIKNKFKISLFKKIKTLIFIA